MDDDALRKHVGDLLRSRGAHVGFEEAAADIPPKLRGVRPAGAAHTPWQILEHLRIAQWDILEFSRSAQHVFPDFPDGYWPPSAAPPDDSAWDRSVSAFKSDLEAMARLVEDSATDLFAPIPHGEGQTILREALLVADHNAYHIGQLVLLRRLLGAWETGGKELEDYG